MGKALIVDDDEKNRRLIEDLLHIKNIEVVSFERGNDAVAGATDDLMFCVIDVRLPDIPGYEVAKRIKEKYPGIPCIAYTASVLEDSLQIINNTGVFDDIVIKPIDIKTFFNTIDKYINH